MYNNALYTAYTLGLKRLVDIDNVDDKKLSTNIYFVE